MPSRRELLNAFNSDKRAARLNKKKQESNANDGDAGEEDAVVKTSGKPVVIPFSSVGLMLKTSKDARTVLAHCGSTLFRKAIDNELWCFIEEFLPMCPEILLYENTYRKVVGDEPVAVGASSDNVELVSKGNSKTGVGKTVVKTYSLLEDAEAEAQDYRCNFECLDCNFGDTLGYVRPNHFPIQCFEEVGVVRSSKQLP